MAKPNYKQAKKQKEAARKARQQEKALRKQARAAELPEGDPQPMQDPVPGPEAS